MPTIKPEDTSADPWLDFNAKNDTVTEEEYQMNKITLTATGDHYVNMQESLYHSYRLGTFCDVKIICGDGASVMCHKLVLAALSDMLEVAFRNAEDDIALLILPDLDSDCVIQCLDALYDCQNGDFYLEKLGAIKKVLGIISAKQTEELFNLKSNMSIKTKEDNPIDLYEAKHKISEGPIDELQFDIPETNVHKLPLEKCRINKVLSIEDLKEQARTLETMMEEKTGTLVVNVKQCQDHSIPRAPLASDGVCYMALVGIKVTGEDHIDALPLIWSPLLMPSDSQLVQRLEYYGNVVKNVYGLSDIEVYGQLHVRTLVGAPRHKPAEHCVVQSELSMYDSSKLKALLDDKEMKIASKRGLTKDSLDKHFNQDEDVVLKMVEDVSDKEVDGVMLVVAYSDGQVIGDILNPCVSPKWERSRRDSVCKNLFQLFFKVVLLKSGQTQCSDCPELVSLYHHYAVLKRRHDIANDYLMDESLQSKLVQTDVCDHCGKEFDVRTIKGKALFTAHKHKHYYENFKCDCSVVLDNLAQKKKHILLVHKKGYTQCDKCTFVGSSKSMALHLEQHYQRWTCEYCGASTGSKYSLAEHVARLHPEKAPADLTKKFEGGVCKHCGMYFKRLATHIKNKCGKDESSRHTVCPDCGKTCNKRALKTHVLRFHTPQEQLPYPCHQCDLRFGTKSLLKRHVTTTHEKFPRFTCKFDGCNASYTHSGSLSNHQRMQHKETYSQAVRKELKRQAEKGKRLNKK